MYLFVCRKGEGLICPLSLFPVVLPYSGIMFDIWHWLMYFW